MAVQLAKYGRRAQSADALRVAAEILGQTKPVVLRTEMTVMPPVDAAADVSVNEQHSIPTSSALLVEAQAMASPAGSPDQVDAGQEGKAKGAVNGPNVVTGCALAGRSDQHHIGFREREPAVVTVEGDGDSDIDCFVRDKHGRPVVSDERRDLDQCVLYWVPLSTQEYQIEVRNVGDARDRYLLVTN